MEAARRGATSPGTAAGASGTADVAGGVVGLGSPTAGGVADIGAGSPGGRTEIPLRLTLGGATMALGVGGQWELGGQRS
jgi:hypothetical protein